VGIILDDPVQLIDRNTLQSGLIEEAFLPDKPAIVSKEAIDLGGLEGAADEVFVGMLGKGLQRNPPLVCRRGNG
jgi:hypothetical protein